MSTRIMRAFLFLVPVDGDKRIDRHIDYLAAAPRARRRRHARRGGHAPARHQGPIVHRPAAAYSDARGERGVHVTPSSSHTPPLHRVKEERS